MSKKSQYRGKGGHQDRRISVRAVRRDPPDVRRLGRALIAHAMEQAKAEAAAQQQADQAFAKESSKDDD